MKKNLALSIAVTLAFLVAISPVFAQSDTKSAQTPASKTAPPPSQAQPSTGAQEPGMMQPGMQPGMMQGQGQMQQQGMMQQSGTQGVQPKAPIKISDYWHKDIYNRDGQKIGTIDDLVTDVYGRLSYIILSHGGFLGIGDKLLPIPMQAVKTSPDNKLVVNLDKNALEKAPNFDKSNWPNFAEPDWVRSTSSYWKLEPMMNEK